MYFSAWENIYYCSKCLRILAQNGSNILPFELSICPHCGSKELFSGTQRKILSEKKRLFSKKQVILRTEVRLDNAPDHLFWAREQNGQIFLDKKI